MYVDLCPYVQYVYTKVFSACDIFKLCSGVFALVLGAEVVLVRSRF